MQPISCLLFPTDRVYAWVGKASFRLEQSRADLRHEPGAQKTARDHALSGDNQCTVVVLSIGRQ